jgi:hypothetical protein
MSPDLLHVVTALANPIRWRSRARLFRDFARHMRDSGVTLTVVECAYGDRPFEMADEPGIVHVPVRARTLSWVKENLLNIGIGRLPQDWKYVAWIDADISFRRPDWASETVHALQQYDFVQPWSDCYDLGPCDEHLLTHRSFCRRWIDREPLGAGPYAFAHPGYAWAATRAALEQVGGLVETAALGAGDHHMALALAGKVAWSMPAGLSSGYRRPLDLWQDRAQLHVAGNIGYVPGTIEHRWHGDKVKRAYVDRWRILIEHGFDPQTDLKRNVWGVFELACNKPALRRDIDAYFRSRDEDSNTRSRA